MSLIRVGIVKNIKTCKHSKAWEFSKMYPMGFKRTSTSRSVLFGHQSCMLSISSTPSTRILLTHCLALINFSATVSCSKQCLKSPMMVSESFKDRVFVWNGSLEGLPFHQSNSQLLYCWMLRWVWKKWVASTWLAQALWNSIVSFNIS